jgi:hypothetical protein
MLQAAAVANLSPKILLVASRGQSTEIPAPLQPDQQAAMCPNPMIARPGLWPGLPTGRRRDLRHSPALRQELQFPRNSCDRIGARR